MGFLAPAAAVIGRALADAIAPPPPPDVTRWAEENVEFDERSPMPGPFRRDRFPFLEEIHRCLSPEHPAREVTVRGSAQWGKTVSVIQPALGAWFSYAPVDALVVHPTGSAATEWVNNKWLPMRRSAPELRRIFGAARGENRDTIMNQETLARTGSLKVASAGSPDDLTGTSRKLVILDDLAKFEQTAKGDPEALAESRASGYEDAKILRVSTPLIAGTCRITRAFNRSDRRLFHVPCPHCGHEAPLTWENFKASIDPERLAAAHFTCEACGAGIGHEHKERIVGLGRWVAGNPAGDHPGFHLWRAYSPFRDWASIARDYAKAMGWTSLTVSSATEAEISATVEAETEQTFYNDVAGLPYEMASSGPDWQKLRDRVELAAEGDVLPRAIVPARGVLLTAGVDCQGDRLEVQIVAHGPNAQRWIVDYVVIPHAIDDDAGRAALDALLKATWRTERGLRLPLDMLAIDGGTYTEDVWSWAKRHPWDRVIIVKGSNSQTGPVMAPQKFERRRDGKVRRAQKRAWLLNVSSMKGELYDKLPKEDPLERGFVHIARGLGDEWFRMITAETRVLRRGVAGVMVSRWELVEPSRRNEALDCTNYAEAAARRKGWAHMTEHEWNALEKIRSAAPVEDQPDLFDAAATAPADLAKAPAAPAAEVEAAPEPVKPKRKPRKREGAAGGAWIETKGDWL